MPKQTNYASYFPSNLNAPMIYFKPSQLWSFSVPNPQSRTMKNR